jgi:1,4-dihydroxy-6-naphthoate synthase
LFCQRARGVAQVSKPALSPIFKSAGHWNFRTSRNSRARSGFGNPRYGRLVRRSESVLRRRSLRYTAFVPILDSIGSLHDVTFALTAKTLMHHSTKASTEIFTLGHSPDPDDAFMFYAMAEKKIDLRGYRFEHRLEDIQTLNERAQRGELHISAISIHASAYVANNYALLPCGASMGDGYGPVLVRKHPTSNIQHPTPNASTLQRFNASTGDKAARESLRTCVIAVPGEMTSAFLALQLFLGKFDYLVVPFDKIFDAVKSGRADAGLIIHEGQLTYAQAGFEKIVDLGEWWKRETGLPLPLGGNVVRKDIPPAVRRDLSEIIRESIDYGLAHRNDAVRHSLAYARNIGSKLTDKFIGMYVNEFTRDYGETGRAAIRKFLDEACDKRFIKVPINLEFVE